MPARVHQLLNHAFRFDVLNLPAVPIRIERNQFHLRKPIEQQQERPWVRDRHDFSRPEVRPLLCPVSRRVREHGIAVAPTFSVFSREISGTRRP